jgi:hypothetical protein
LRPNPDEGFPELSLDRFVAALPRDDGEAVSIESRMVLT